MAERRLSAAEKPEIFGETSGDLHNYAGKYLVKEDTITIFCRQVDEVCPLKHVQIVENGKTG